MKTQQVGELAKKLSEAYIIGTNYQIPWEKVTGMRNRFAHEYGNMNYEMIWKTASRDIPVLKKFCEEQLEEYDKENPT